MENHPRNQHYVPRFLLKIFHSDEENKIWCYDKVWKREEERSIAGVASEDYFYDEVKGQKEDSLEYLFTQTESETSPIIKRLIETKDISELSIDERITIALFAALQFCRTKAALDRTEEFRANFFDKIDSWRKENLLENNLHRPDPTESWRTSFQDAPHFAAIFLRKHWFLLESDHQFYTSDNPFVLQNSVNFQTNQGTLGINSDGIEMYLPLSPSLIFCMYCERTLQKIPSPFPCPDTTVENLNSLQVIFSKRFVFSHRKNFSLVKDMLSSNTIYEA